METTAGAAGDDWRGRATAERDGAREQHMAAGPSGGIRELSDLPIWVAPMAGGPSTPGLVVAAGRSGALGFLAGGYKTAEAMRAEITAVRAAGVTAFGVNVFVPGHAAYALDLLRPTPAVRSRFEQRLAAVETRSP